LRDILDNGLLYSYRPYATPFAVRSAITATAELLVVCVSVPVCALIVLIDNFKDEIAGRINKYSASSLHSNGHLVDRFRLVCPSD